MPNNDEVYLDEYSDWKDGYRQQSEDLLSDVGYTMGQTVEERQRMEYAKATLSGVNKTTLQQEADKFIQQQKLDKVANAYTANEKVAEIKQTAKIKGVTINTFELDFLIADSLQRIEAGENPRAEYYGWVEDQQKIENDINSMGTTQNEVDARNGFIDFLGERETEMRRIIALYAGTAVYGEGVVKEQALERLAFMNFKMSELRRLRAKTQATKEKVDTLDNGERIGRAMTIGTMEVAHEHMKDKYLEMKSGINSREFERGFGEEFIRFRPVTETREAAIKKIETVQGNSRRTGAILTAMRMGKSLEVLEREEAKKQNIQERPNIRRFNGFNVNRFRDVSGEQLYRA